MLPIGTILFSNSFKKIGTVVGYNFRNTYYDVDSDDEFFWNPNDVKEISSEEEAMFYRLKYE